MKIYQSQVGKPVQEVVRDPGLSNAAGVASLGQSLTQATAQVGNIYMNAVYGQETGEAKTAYIEAQTQYLANLRENPIYNNRDENGDLIPREDGFGHLNEQRTKDWDDFSKEFMATREGLFSHGRAKEDFTSWADAQNQATSAEINNEAITETLAYMGELTMQEVKAMVDAEKFDIARDLYNQGISGGVFSLEQGATLEGYIQGEQDYVDARNDVMNGTLDEDGGVVTEGYDAYDDHFLGWEASFDQIDEMGVSETMKDRLREHVNGAFKDDMFVEKEFSARALEAGWNEHTNIIETWTGGDVEAYKKKIGQDERLTASAKEHLWDRFDAIIRANGATGPAGTQYEQNYISEAQEAWADPNSNDEEYQQTLRRLQDQGIINSDAQYFYWANKSRPGSLQRGSIYDGSKMLDKVWNSLMTGADDDEKGAYATRGLYAMNMFEQRCKDAGPNLTEDMQQDFLGEAINYIIGESISDGDPFASRPAGDQFAGRWRQDDFEGGIARIRSGNNDFTADWAGNAEGLIFIENEGLRRLQAQYSERLSNIQVRDSGTADIHYSATDAMGNPVYYRYNATENGKEVFLEKYGADGWGKSSLLSNEQLQGRQDWSDVDGANPWELTFGPEKPEPNGPADLPMVGEIPEIFIHLPISELQSRLGPLDIHMDRQQILDAKLDHVYEMFEVITNPRQKTQSRIERRLEQNGYPESMSTSGALEILRRMNSQ